MDAAARIPSTSSLGIAMPPLASRAKPQPVVVHLLLVLMVAPVCCEHAVGRALHCFPASDNTTRRRLDYSDCQAFLELRLFNAARISRL